MSPDSPHLLHHLPDAAHERRQLVQQVREGAAPELPRGAR